MIFNTKYIAISILLLFICINAIVYIYYKQSFNGYYEEYKKNLSNINSIELLSAKYKQSKINKQFFDSRMLQGKFKDYILSSKSTKTQGEIAFKGLNKSLTQDILSLFIDNHINILSFTLQRIDDNFMNLSIKVRF